MFYLKIKYQQILMTTFYTFVVQIGEIFHFKLVCRDVDMVYPVQKGIFSIY